MPSSFTCLSAAPSPCLEASVWRTNTFEKSGTAQIGSLHSLPIMSEMLPHALLSVGPYSALASLLHPTRVQKWWHNQARTVYNYPSVQGMSITFTLWMDEGNSWLPPLCWVQASLCSYQQRSLGPRHAVFWGEIFEASLLVRLCEVVGICHANVPCGLLRYHWIPQCHPKIHPNDLRHSATLDSLNVGKSQVHHGGCMALS